MIVDFGAEENEFEPKIALPNSSKNDSHEIKVEIKVNKSKVKKEP
jgi:hypothetical protein